MKVRQTARLNPTSATTLDGHPLDVPGSDEGEYTFACEPNGGNCVGVKRLEDGRVQVASTLTPVGGSLVLTAEEWDNLLQMVCDNAANAGMLNITNLFNQEELDSFAEDVRMKEFAHI